MLFDGANLCPGEIIRCLEMLIKCAGHLVDLVVGALGRKDGGHQQLKGRLVEKGRDGLRVAFFQNPANSTGAGLKIHFICQLGVGVVC